MDVQSGREVNLKNKNNLRGKSMEVIFFMVVTDYLLLK